MPIANEWESLILAALKEQTTALARQEVATARLEEGQRALNDKFQKLNGSVSDTIERVAAARNEREAEIVQLRANIAKIENVAAGRAGVLRVLSPAIYLMAGALLVVCLYHADFLLKALIH